MAGFVTLPLADSFEPACPRSPVSASAADGRKSQTQSLVLEAASAAVATGPLANRADHPQPNDHRPGHPARSSSAYSQHSLHSTPGAPPRFPRSPAALVPSLTTPPRADRTRWLRSRSRQ
ncbi:hypothetical protein MN608_07270 [Microdochium nivale]|nr:hypothetical protein MN608_07270 [Microdochium nivale]